ncbi:MAG: hypothetical protein WCI53_06090 [Bacteroidota bacterium]
MKITKYILTFITFFLVQSNICAKGEKYCFEFYGDSVSISNNIEIEDVKKIINKKSSDFNENLLYEKFDKTVNELLKYRNEKKLNDWIYYQLVRKVANNICDKNKAFNEYTILKWFLMSKSGYDSKLVSFKKSYLFYIKSDENVYDIPFFILDNKQYICLNYHDFVKINFKNNTLKIVEIYIPEATKSFSYKVSHLPDFALNTFTDKDLNFNYKEKTYHFKIKLSNDVQQIFKNYPVVDFETYFNIPFNKETYNSLFPYLKENIKNFELKEGVDYLMNFTRHAFLYENDIDNFGKEKRLSPEQTLLFEHSDCDDRAALFFYLIKEIYNLPIIAVLYPTHIVIAIHFEKSEGKSILYNGRNYSICDPTPQRENLLIGQISSELIKTPFQVVYEYLPLVK